MQFLPQIDSIQSNPWMNPIRVQLCSASTFP